ncbi:RNA polymerase sigma factor [Georgenia alba]|uniref:RNA polymerase sigma factor n=1 Tax=Georgenia alba TaxID=2233858 RepID=A0ABW2Q5H9_9MICO
MGDGDDEAVWARVCAGASADFGIVWDRHRDHVHRYLITVGTDRADAEDLTAVVFRELWRRRRTVRFNDDGSLLPWLLATARNVHRNAARSRRRFRAFLDRLPPPEPTAPADRAIDATSDLVQVRQALATETNPLDRELLGLTLEGMTIAEAAGTLGLTEAAAKTRLTRLRSRLRQRIAAQEAPELETDR